MNNNLYFDLIKNYSSPYYIFDYEVLNERIDNLIKLSPDNVKLCYAIKANPFLIPALQNKDLLFEVCSPGELSICEKYKVNPEQIVFSGVCKTYEDVERAYIASVKTITLESKLHCDYLLEAINNNTEIIHNQEVILRKTCGNQFGMSENDIVDCIKELQKVPNIVIRGIHYFTGTQKKQQKIQDEIEQIVSYCNNLKKTLNIKFNEIEYGPGLAYNYFSGSDEKINYSEYTDFINSIKNLSYNFVIELGRYIASPCGEYVTSIKDIKSDNDKNYCIIDGGINHINYYGQMLGMKVPLVNHIKQNSEKVINTKKYCICGSLCTTADVVIRELELNEPQLNDLIVFKDIGAYSITEGIYLFLSHAMPSVIIKNNNGYELVRNQIETFTFNS